MSSLKLPISISTLLVFLSFATSGNGENASLEPSIECCHTATCIIPEAFLPPARIDEEGCWKLDVQASFIYWDARLKGLDYGFLLPLDPTTETGPRLSDHFSFQPGFKVGLGWDLNYDGWVTSIGFTRLKTTDSTSSALASSTVGILPLWLPDPTLGDGPPSIDVLAIGRYWEMKYSMLDWELFRPTYFSRSFILTPVIGIRGGWITQQFIVNHTVIFPLGNTGNLAVHSYERAALIGPRVGFKNKFLLGQGFCFDGSSSFALLAQDITTRMIRESYNNPGSLSANVSNKERFFTPFGDISLGFGWGSFFNCRRWYLDASLVYDIQLYLFENNMRHLKDSFDERVYSASQILILQGITATLKFDI